jgi:putative protease
MKSPEYVRDVARIFRRLLDEGRGADASEMTALAEIFSRGGFTDGYYTKKIGRSMLGIRSEGDKQSSRALTPFDRITRKLPLTLSAELSLGTPISLTASDGKKTVTVYGAVPEEARTAPLTREAVEKNLSKLGNTPYFLERLTLSLADGIILPLSSLNALRRLAVEKLAESETRSEADFTDLKSEDPQKISAAEGKTALFYFPDRIPKEAYGYFDVLYTPLEKYDGQTNGVLLPPVIFDSERERVEKMLTRAKELGAAHLLVGNAGHVELARASGLILHGDHRLNITNSETAIQLSQYFTDVIASPELTLPRLRDLCRNSPNVRTAIYGRTPLMITEKCVGKELGGCDICESGRAALTDRRGVSFPVLRIFDHRSLIVNSLPLYMADKKSELDRMGLNATHFIFTVESREEIARIINAYKRSTPPTGEVRRIK